MARPEKPMGRPRITPVFEIEYQGEKRLALEVIGKSQGNSGAAAIPAEWVGKKVICILLD